MLKAFGRDTRGSVAIIFSVSIVAIICCVGAAVDYARLNTMKTQLNVATDAAALAGARLAMTDMAAAEAAAEASLKSNFRDAITISNVKVSLIKGSPADSFRVDASVAVPMTISKVMGYQHMPVSSFAEVVVGSDVDLQIALALDTTGSMKGARLTALKSASSNMVNLLYDRLQRSNQVKMSVVPFARYVNVGLGNRNQPWMSVPADYSETKEVCSTSRPVIRTYNCRPQTSTSYNDGVPTTKTTTVCDYEYGPSVKTCGPRTSNYKWNGCAGSRNSPLDTMDSQYTTKIPGILNVSCPAALVPLTASRPTVLNAINKLVASDETYIPSGLIWGWRTLSAGAPFDEPTNPKVTTTRYLILMTDGVNTVSPSYPSHGGKNQAVADKISADLCRNIKTSGVVVFTIAFEVTDVGVKKLLQDCASQASNFFDATDAAQLTASFTTIAEQMVTLRLTK